MPTLSITVRASELLGEQKILLERPYKFTKLVLKHIYHNIDAGGFAGKEDKAAARLLYLRMTGLTNSKNVINYTGDYSVAVQSDMPARYSNADFQEGQGTVGVSQTSTDTTTKRARQDISIDHLLPLGPTKVSSKDMTSRDLLLTLHHGGAPLVFDGELGIELHYLDFKAAIVPITETSGGIQQSISKGVPVSFMTIVFEYEEIPM